MATSRGEIKGRILRTLMKTSLHKGFYTNDSINDAIQESLDYISTHMFVHDGGWATKIEHFDTVGNQKTINVPVGCAMIKEVRYLFGTDYIPMTYDEGQGSVQSADNSGIQQWAYVYRIVDNAIYFNPVLAQGGPDYLQIEYMAYSKRLQDDEDFLESHFDRAMENFVMYRSCSILSSRIEKFAVPWKALENDWYQKIVEIVGRRNLQSTQIREYTGGY